MNSSDLYLEIGQSSLKALDGDDGLELSLERQENGRLTPLCAEGLVSSLRVFLKKRNWRPQRRAFCALGARGVSLRRVSLPAASKEEVERLLPLQIEREFPLAPEELAWGYRELDRARGSTNGAPAATELLVAAIKRDVLQEYADVLTQSGLEPVFTLGALARSSLCAQPPKNFAVLDIGRAHSELISFENGAPASLRVLPWGGETITGALEKELAIPHPEAEKLKQRVNDETVAGQERGEVFQAVLRAQVHSLAHSMQPGWIGSRLYLSGETARLKDFAPQLAKALGGTVECARLDWMQGEGRSAAILGLRRACENDAASPPLTLQLARRSAEKSAQPVPWRWAALAGILLAGLFFLRYAEAFLLQPRLTRRLAEIKAYREKLPNIDRELSFLLYLKTNQPPYLDAIFGLASAAPPGTRVETLSLSARGDLSLRATMRDSQQLADLRSKLLDSGLFSSVVVEEQTPSPDRQKLTVRMTGRWKPERSERKTSPADPARLAVNRTNAVARTNPVPSMPPKITEGQAPSVRKGPATND